MGHAPAFGAEIVFSYLAGALQHVPRPQYIAPRSVLHFLIVRQRSRRLPSRPSASERRRPQRPHALRGLGLPFSYRRVPGHALCQRPRQYPRVPRRESLSAAQFYRLPEVTMDVSIRLIQATRIVVGRRCRVQTRNNPT
jgi:hypothetical protein